MEEIEPSKADLRNKFLNQLIFRGSLGQTDQLALQSALAKKRKFKRLETDFNVVNLEMLSDNEEYQKSQRQRYKKLLRQDKWLSKGFFL